MRERFSFGFSTQALLRFCLTIGFFFLVHPWATWAAPNGSGLDFPRLLDENIAKEARAEGLLLMVQANRWEGHAPASHYDLVRCVDEDGGWNPDRSGFDTADRVELHANPFGLNSGLTAKFSGFFRVTEAGDWRFAVNASGPAEIEIDGRVAAAWYGDHTAGNFFDTHSGTVPLSAGWHRLVFRYAAPLAGTPYAEGRFMPPSGGSWQKITRANLDLRSFPAADGLGLVTRHNTRTEHPETSDELYLNIERFSLPQISRYGWSRVDELHQTENIHGDDTAYTSYYEAYFQVTEAQSGDWHFALNSGDAAELEIDGQVVAAWYGGHEPAGDHGQTGTVSLSAGWHKLVVRHALVDAAPTIRGQFQAPGDSAWRPLATTELPLKAFVHDLDQDGIHNDLEGILGTRVEGNDSDVEGLGDFAEAMLDSDPLEPDSNGDGLGDAVELAYADSDPDGDGVVNLWDRDNDNDGVIDALDSSPFTATASKERFQFEITTSGKHTALDFQIRPENPMNLMLSGQKWDWPYDIKGQMQDRDNSTEDLTLVPMLELSANLLPDQDSVRENGIAIANDALLSVVDGHMSPNDGFATGNVLGTGRPQLVVAWDKDKQITVRDRDGNKLSQFDSVFSTGDALAVADVLGDETDEILVFNDYNSKVYVYSGEGHLITKQDVVYQKGYPVVVGDYCDVIGGTIALLEDRKAEIIVGDPDNRRLWVFGIIGDRYSYRVTHLHSPVGAYTDDDGLAVADVDGDGRQEIAVAHNVDDLLKIYGYRGDAFTEIAAIPMDYDRSDGLLGVDILPSADPADSRYGEELMVLKRGGDRGMVYTEVAREEAGDLDSLAYSTLDGYSTADLYGDGLPEIVVASDTSGAVQVYNPATSKAYVPLSPVTDNGTTVAFQGRMLYNATGGGVTLNADVRLVWFVVGKSDSEAEPGANEPVILAKYPDPFRLTGFSATEHRGESTALFYHAGAEAEARDALSSAYSVLEHRFLNSDLSLAEVETELAHYSITVSCNEITDHTHDYPAAKWTEAQLEALIAEALPDGTYPVLAAGISRAATLSLADLTETSSSGILSADLAGLATDSMKSIKMNWYDTAQPVVAPLTIDRIETVAQGWNLSPEKTDHSLSMVLIFSMGQIGKPVDYEPGASHSPLAWLKRGGTSLAKIIPATNTVWNIYQSTRLTMGYNAMIGARGYTVAKLKWARAFELQRAGSLFTKLGFSAKTATRISATVSKLGKFGGPITGIASAAYTFYLVGSGSGWSNSGTAMATNYALMQGMYTMALIMIAAVPVAGQVIVAVIVVSDVVTWVVTGQGWSDRAMEWVAEKLMSTKNPVVDIDISNTRLMIADYDDNGLTVGDRVEFRFRATETVQRYSEHDETSDEGEEFIRDMRSSSLQPSAEFRRVETKRTSPFPTNIISRFGQPLACDVGSWVQCDPAIVSECVLQTCAPEDEGCIACDDGVLYGKREPGNGIFSATALPDDYYSGIERLFCDPASRVRCNPAKPRECELQTCEPGDDHCISCAEGVVTHKQGYSSYLCGADGSSRLLVDYDLSNSRKQKIWDFGAWIEPDRATSNLALGLRVTTDLQLYLRQCTKSLGAEISNYLLPLDPYKLAGIDTASCDRERIEDSDSSILTILDFDILPASLADFVTWSAISPLDRDHDGLADTLEGDPTGPWFSLGAVNGEGAAVLADAMGEEPDGTIDHVYWTDETSEPAARRRWRITPDGQGYFQFTNQYNEAQGWAATLTARENDIAWVDQPQGDDSLWKITGLRDDRVSVVNKGFSDARGEPWGFCMPTSPGTGWALSLHPLENTTLSPLWRIQLLGGPTRADANDSDGDGLSDFFELNAPIRGLGLDPLNPDTDGDGLTDRRELEIGCSPVAADSDGDGLADGIEIAGWPVALSYNGKSVKKRVFSNPLVADSDGDGLSDEAEFSGAFKLNPASRDTDGDGIPDNLDSDPTNPPPGALDSDTDGLHDEVETAGWTLSLTTAAGNEVRPVASDPAQADSDGDGLSDLQEYTLSDPGNSDSDGDGLLDPDELTRGTDMLHFDTDRDGLADGLEVGLGTDPRNGDSDSDGLGDQEEVNLHGTDPTRIDSDGDGLTDDQEVNGFGTDPTDSDSDNDTLSDGAEVQFHRTNPLAADSDGDGLTDDAERLTYDTRADSGDSDGDGLTDFEEVNWSCAPASGHLNPLAADSDGDGLSDAREIQEHGTHPCMADSDSDGLADGEEIGLGTDPNDADSDDDTLEDGDEVHRHGSNPLAADSDGDHLSDDQEVNLFGTDPADSDSDNDGIPDDQDPNTVPLLNLNIPTLLVLYDELNDSQLRVISELQSLLGEDKVEAGTPDQFTLADYSFILMLGLPDVEAPEGSVALMLDQLLDAETRAAMLAYQDALEAELTGGELDEARLRSLQARMAGRAVPIYNGLPQGGYGTFPVAPPPGSPQVEMGLENSLIVVLSTPLPEDPYRVIVLLKELQALFWENFIQTAWIPASGSRDHFSLNGQAATDATLAATLTAYADTGMAALVSYPEGFVDPPLETATGLAAGEDAIGKYILVESAASNIAFPPGLVPLQSATLRIYYTALELDRSLPKNGDITAIGDINEETLALYHRNDGTGAWEKLTSGVTLNTANITVGDTEYEGYLEVALGADLGLFTFSGIPHPDTTLPGAPAVVASDPAADAASVPIDAPLEVTLSEPVTAQNLEGIELAGAVILSATLEGNLLTLVHDGLVPGATYEVSIPDGAVVDSAGIHNEAYSWRFTAVEANQIPFANNDDLSCDEDGFLTVNVLNDHGHGADWDSEGDPLAVTAVNGDSGNLNISVPGSGGGRFQLATDGSLSFETFGEFDYLGAGEWAETAISYTLGDGFGADTATITVSVSGTNSRPLLSSDRRWLRSVTADAGNDNWTDEDGDNDGSENFDNPGDWVASIIASSGTAQDSDGDLLGIAVVAADNRRGAWQYTLDQMAWTEMPVFLSETHSLLLPPAARVRFVPDPRLNCDSTPGLSFKLWDQSSGTAGGQHYDTAMASATSLVTAVAAVPVNSVTWLPPAGDADGDGIENCDDESPLPPTFLDTDNDGMDDAWERLYFGNLNRASKGSDFDRDRYSDLHEYLNWGNGILDPAGKIFDPTRINKAAGENYGIGLTDNEFWQLVLPAILNAARNRAAGAKASGF